MSHVIAANWWLWLTLSLLFIGFDLNQWDHRCERLDRGNTLTKAERDEVRRLVWAPKNPSGLYTRAVAIIMVGLLAASGIIHIFSAH